MTADPLAALREQVQRADARHHKAAKWCHITVDEARAILVLAAAPRADSLDVERLARAQFRCSGEGICPSHDYHRVHAANVITEYAKLAER